MQTVPPTSEFVDTTLAAVLARPEFESRPAVSLFGILFRALGWVWDRAVAGLRWLFPDLDGSEPIWSVLGKGILIAVGVAALVMLVRALLPFLSRLRRDGRRSGGGALERDTGPRTAEDWESRAREARDAGRWRDAAVALYHAVVHRMAASEHLRLDPAKTPGEYRREARARPEAPPVFQTFVRRFEPVAFGRVAADRSAYEALRGLAGELGAHG